MRYSPACYTLHRHVIRSSDKVETMNASKISITDIYVRHLT